MGFGGLYLKLDPELLLAQIMKRFDDQHELLSKAGWQLRFSGFGLLQVSNVFVRSSFYSIFVGSHSATFLALVSGLRYSDTP